MNCLLDETRSERIDLGLPFLKQIRLSPTLAAVLSEMRVQQYADDHSYFLTMGHLLGYDMTHTRLRSESAPVLLERLLAKQESMNVEIRQLALGLRGECGRGGKGKR